MLENDNLQNADGNEETHSKTEEKATDVTNTNEIEAPVENKNADDAIINEIEAVNAEDAEDEGNSERHTIEVKAYEEMSLEALAIELEKLLQNEKVQAIKQHVDQIRNEFNTKFNTLLEEKKEAFISEGGNEIDFFYSSPVQQRFKKAYKQYRGKLHEHYQKLESNLKDNLKVRLEIIENIKALMQDAEDSMNTKYKQFKDLQDAWKNAGPIPRDKYNNAWNSYHFNVERFYDLLHLDRDLRDKDFKYNLDKKLKIIERAEELANDDNTNRSFRELQVLHKLWKEDLGPVAKEYREEIWERFKNATKKIHDKRQDYFAHLDEIHEQNLIKKEELIEKINTITMESMDSHNAIQTKIKLVEGLREAFFKAGKVPIKVNEATWAKFKEAVRNFNRKKNAFYKNLKKGQQLNLEKKLQLIQIAEDNKDNDDFETTTPLMKKIQGDWKKIGHVPRRDSDKIWKQFKTACNHYFDRIHAERHAETKEQEVAFDKKSTFLESLKSIELTGDQNADLATIKTHIATWKTLGRVPHKKRQIEQEFNKTLDHLFKRLDLNKTESELIKYENKLEQLNSNQDRRALDNELNYIRKKVDELKGEINQLENNLQFFSNVDESNPLVKEVHKNIKRHKQDLEIWQSKFTKIKALYA